MQIDNEIIEEEKYKNKLNIKDDLQNFWDGKEEIQEVKEKRINNNNEIKIESYINKNENTYMKENSLSEDKKEINFNLNKNEDNEKNKNIILITILSIITISTIIIYNLYQNEQEKLKIQTEIDNENSKITRQKSIEEFNERMARKKQEQIHNNNNNNNNYKYFKIAYEMDNNFDSNFIYNMHTITNNLSNAKSRSEDNNYDIEIVGSVSKYGDLFYRIDKRKVSNEYDNQINNILTQLKKIKFKLQNDTVNFKIYVNNNSYDLN